MELASFTAALDGDAAVLRWTTESETNNAGFHVEQQAGLAWTPVAFVAGRGTTSERTTYGHTVRGLSAGTYRFRLRQVDLDGTASYSPSVEVSVGMARALDLAVVGATVRFAVREAQAVRAELFNALGQRLAVLVDAEVAAGTPQAVAVPGDLPAGMYFVRVSGAGFTGSVRVPITR